MLAAPYTIGGTAGMSLQSFRNWTPASAGLEHGGREWPILQSSPAIGRWLAWRFPARAASGWA